MRTFLALMLCLLSCSVVQKPVPVVAIPHVEPEPTPTYLRFIVLGSITMPVVGQVQQGFIRAEKLKVPVLIELNSTGGEYVAGFLIAKRIELASVPVVCVVDSDAESMAFYILQSCKIRIMTKRSMLMVHNPYHPYDPERTPEQNEADVEEAKPRIAALSKAMVEQYAYRMKLSRDEIVQKIDGKDWYINWEEALVNGAVDLVVDRPEEALDMLLNQAAQKKADQDDADSKSNDAGDALE